MHVPASDLTADRVIVRYAFISACAKAPASVAAHVAARKILYCVVQTLSEDMIFFSMSHFKEQVLPKVST